MRTISEITKLFYRMDRAVGLTRLRKYDKSLRNISQRYAIPYTNRGRVLLYGDTSIILIRFVFQLKYFGLSARVISVLLKEVHISDLEVLLEKAKAGDPYLSVKSFPLGDGSCSVVFHMGKTVADLVKFGLGGKA
jgi:hypothetical protein